MKCPQCSRNHQLGKYGMKCGCNYHFCFNPKAQGTLGLTDGKFLGWVRAASQNDTTYFTRNQLYAVYCRRLRKSPVTSLVIGGVLLILAAGIYFTISPQKPGSELAAQAGIAFFFWCGRNHNHWLRPVHCPSGDTAARLRHGAGQMARTRTKARQTPRATVTA